MISCDKLKYQVSQQFLSHDMIFMLHWIIHCTTARSSVQKFDNNCDIIMMFKIQQNISIHEISVKEAEK